MTRTLDDDLAAAAPPVCDRTPELSAAVRELIADTEHQARREVADATRRKRKVVVAALATAALVGTFSTAAAAGWSPTSWWDEPESTRHPAISSAGSECSFTYAPRSVIVQGHPVSAGDRAAAMSAAGEFLRRFDYTTIAGADEEAQFETLNAQLTQALRRQGLSTHAVSVAFASDCVDGVDR